MLRERATIFRRLMILTDFALVAGAFFLAYYVRNINDALPPIGDLQWFLVLFACLWWLTLYMSGMYESFRLKGIPEVLYMIYQSAYFSFLIFAVVCYLLRVEHISRIFVLLSFAFAIAFLVVEKAILIQVFRNLRQKGYNYRNVLIVGTGKRARHFIDWIDHNKEFGLNIVGLVADDEDAVGTEVDGHKIIGTMDDIPSIHRANALDSVLFAVPYLWLGKIEKAMTYLETVGVKIDIALDYFSNRMAQAKHTEFCGVPLLSFESSPEHLLPFYAKRLFDIILSAVALVLLAPVMVIVAFFIKITSKGPILFGQERGSLNGRKFRLYKFRTMVADAESKLDALKAHNEMQGAAFKMANDPRVTPLGKWLRKLSIDELPQLWNVLRGDMSLVGPRPPLIHEVAEYDDWQRRRLSMRPGITCLWQVNGRNKITNFEEWAKLDLLYIDHWSLWLDIKILLKTIPVVLFGIGAK